jgi:hypothetical protein
MTELTYTLHDDLLFSCMELTEEEQMPLGKYGRMKLQYLNEQRPGLFARLLLSGQLMHQLHEVDRTALRRMDILLPQMMTEAGLTEELKNADPLQWVGTMNAITAQIEEILLAELVYS